MPYYISLQGREIFYIPALYQRIEITDAQGMPYYDESFTMITRPANEVMKGIHNDGENKDRMPLFLTPELEQAWILDELSEKDMQEIFSYQMPSESMVYQPVFTLRGKQQRPDGKHKYDYWSWENLPPLGNDTPLQAQLSLF